MNLQINDNDKITEKYTRASSTLEKDFVYEYGLHSSDIRKKLWIFYKKDNKGVGLSHTNNNQFQDRVLKI